MKILVGRCPNLEFCRNATTQRLIEIPDDEPFICPQCSTDLVAVREKTAGNKTALIALQAAVVVAGAGVLGWKLLTPSAQVAPQSHAPQATAAELALAEAPDAPVATPLPAEPTVQTLPSPPPATAASTAAVPPPAPPPAHVLLRLAGSDVMAAHMARRLAAGYLALIGDTGITIETGNDPATVQVTGMQAGQRESIAITSNGSAGGFTGLADGHADIAMSMRQPDRREAAALAPLGNVQGAQGEHIVGVEGVAVVVNPARQLAGIGKSQLRDIVDGTAKDWSALGQKPAPLHLYTLSGSTDQMDTPLIMFSGDSGAGLTAIPEQSNADIVAAVNRDPNGIGLVATGDTGSARVLPVADAADRPVAPDDAAVASEDYPLTMRLYFYNAPANANSFVRRFTDYSLSAAGQAVVEAAGFVPLTVKTQAAPPAASGAQAQAAPDKLQAAVKGAERLSTTFRFEPGSTVLDNRAMRDVARLAAYLRTKQVDGSHLILVGFADNTGTPQANETVAQKRVGSVVSALGQAGINPGHTEAFGADFPIADNTTSEGREKNRRVEAYLTP